MNQLRTAAVLFVSFLICLASSVSGQDRFSFLSDSTSSGSIPSPQEFLGYAPGEDFTLHGDLLRYLNALDKSSTRVSVIDYGKTHENRRLVYLVITSEENHTRLDDIRSRNLELLTLSGYSDRDIEQKIVNQPAIQWLSYNIHGNEASSSEAAMQVAYNLAVSKDATVREILDQTVVIIDPCVNPDGRDRYVNWYKSARSAQTNLNPDDYEHDEPWPGGRTNHYWFDLNRDWVWLVHPESQGRIRAYQQWMPQVHVDYHEQGFNSNYFTMPGTTPKNQVLPEDYERWAEYFGRANTDAFDEKQINYFTREAFDFFYPGYGSSYPSVMGSIGMLTEQGGGSRGARAVKTNDGYVLTLRQRIYDHYLTSLATLKATADRREELLQYFVDFFQADKTGRDPNAAYLLEDNPDDRTIDLVNLLLEHGVEVDRATEDFDLSAAKSYRTEKSERRKFGEGTFIVRTDQPRHVFVRTLMQQRMAIDDSVMYDMSTWSAPLAFNLEAYSTPALPDIKTNRVTEPVLRESGVTNLEAGYAYIISSTQLNMPKALAALWKSGYRVRSVQRPFTTGGRRFERGTLVILQGRNTERKDTIKIDMQRIAQECGVEIVGVSTGRVEEGIDLASARSVPVAKPNVGMFVDAPFSSYTAGQLWYLFDKYTGFGIDRLRVGRFNALDLNEYDVLILPDAGSILGSYLDSLKVQKIQEWVEAGGTLVALEGAASFVSKERSGLASTQLVKKEPLDANSGASTATDWLPWEARQDSLGRQEIPGTALRSRLDITHPLAYGMNHSIYSLKLGDDALQPSKNAAVVGAFVADEQDLVASGYISRYHISRLAGKSWAVVEPKGAGKLVLISDNTQYRMFWLGPARLVQNAVMLLHAM